MKILIAALLAGLAIAIAPAAHADGTPGCSNPCVVDGDATVGDVTKGAEYSPAGVYHNDTWPDLPTPKHPARLGPIREASGALDDNAQQDMTPYDNTAHSTWPAYSNTTEDYVNSDAGE